MANRTTAALACLALCLLFSAGARPAAAQTAWKDALEQRPEWYGSDEAVRVADNLLLYQRDAGGWPKNIDMARPLNDAARAALARRKQADDSTIDNGATYTQLVYLARVHTARGLERHRESFLRGLDYLFRAQYENGGWPQYYPRLTGYYRRITFNDNAMVNVMRLLRDVARRKPDYLFVGEERRARAERAIGRGVELMLRTQVVVGGERTVWAAQHDEVTLAPAPARKFEPASLVSRESVGVVRFLMSVSRPDARTVEAVEAAVRWFEKSKVTGVRWVERRDPSKPGGFSRAAVRDPSAGPLWARFYELGTNRPVFVGRDGVVRYDVSEIEEERRDGYAWYTEEPAELLGKDYPAWRKRLERQAAEGAK